ncbi:Imm8 family immunity protein [Nocardioides lijunqiniae]|uniref:Imm8 family immunity protein n=1 Tax=Nocardioides lijunqiniae TaxID=2760832 RepID=UPI001877DCE1|nr:Imm8 family immunity protein [Nocardioides lijunqiniae]
MQAVLKSLDLDPHPSTLPADAAEFSLHARMIVGPSGSPGEESFDLTVCTPEWLAKACRKAGGIYDARHHLVVSFTDFDQRVLHDWLAARVQETSGDTWAEVGERLGRLGFWEFEDYRP